MARKTTAEISQRGRPSKQTPALLAKLFKLIEQGHTRRRAAIKCQISPNTLQRWMLQNDDLMCKVYEAEEIGS